MVQPRQKDARGENTKTNYGMDTTVKKEKRTPKEKWLEGVQAAMTTEIQNQINGETERNGVWFPEDSDSCLTLR